jgi:hypothetical protein
MFNMGRLLFVHVALAGAEYYQAPATTTCYASTILLLVHGMHSRSSTFAKEYRTITDQHRTTSRVEQWRKERGENTCKSRTRSSIAEPKSRPIPSNRLKPYVAPTGRCSLRSLSSLSHVYRCFSSLQSPWGSKNP